jgi:hypothetical protein
MHALDGFWHLLNFFWPAAFTAAFSAGLAKLVWRRELAAVRWIDLAAWSAGAGALVLLGGLWLLERDGKLATYGVLVLANALALRWRGWRGWRA